MPHFELHIQSAGFRFYGGAWMLWCVVLVIGNGWFLFAYLANYQRLLFCILKLLCFGLFKKYLSYAYMYVLRLKMSNHRFNTHCIYYFWNVCTLVFIVYSVYCTASRISFRKFVCLSSSLFSKWNGKSNFHYRWRTCFGHFLSFYLINWQWALRFLLFVFLILLSIQTQ